MSFRPESMWFPLVLIILLPNMMKIACEFQLAIEQHYVFHICTVGNDTILSTHVFPNISN